ncbi:MAG: hypothetical protein GWO24_14695 [Akkermansiaceae bacterium]|nr:hypothetical protein [Akkermansiaceae bacterium]
MELPGQRAGSSLQFGEEAGIVLGPRHEAGQLDGIADLEEAGVTVTEEADGGIVPGGEEGGPRDD